MTPDGGELDRLGSSVAVWGDAVVAGAPGADLAGGLDQGAAYLFAKAVGSGWEAAEATKLRTSDGGSYDGFGGSVALDGESMVVGAPGWDGEGVEEVGAV